MKLLWIVHENKMSGANLCLLEYLDILQKNKIENYLIVSPIGDASEKFGSKAKNVFFIKFYSWIWPLNKPMPFLFMLRRWIRNRRAVTHISTVIRKLDPDFVVTNTVATPVAALAAKRTGKKHIWFVHEFGEEDHGFTIGGSFSNAATCMNKLSYKLVFNSAILLKKYERFVPPGKRFIVHNACIMSSVKPVELPGDKIKIIMLGQIAPSKNQLDALQALVICIENGLNIELNVVGSAEDEHYKTMITDFIDSKKIQPFVNFLGSTSHPEILLPQNDILLMCSRMEAFGRVSVEALKCGVPVIAANVGGSLEIIQDNVNGYLYESSDYESLADKIIAYSKNKLHFNRNKIAADARNNFNAAKTEDQLLQVFN